MFDLYSNLYRKTTTTKNLNGLSYINIKIKIVPTTVEKTFF